MNEMFEWLFNIFPLLRDWMYLEIQVDIAYWNKIATLLSGFSLIVSIFALIGGISSLYLTRRSVKENREIGEAQTRSYIIITGAEAEIYNAGTESDPIERYKIAVHAKVVGQTPVRDMKMSYKFYESFKNGGFTSIVHSVEDEYHGGRAPGEEFLAFSISSPLEPGNENYEGDHDAILDADVAFIIIGSIKYLPVVGNKTRVTSFAYEFGQHKKLAVSGRHLIPRPIEELTKSD